MQKKTFLVQICVEIEEFPNGVMDYGPNYNKTIPEGTVVQFSCNQGRVLKLTRKFAQLSLVYRFPASRSRDEDVSQREWLASRRYCQVCERRRITF